MFEKFYDLIRDSIYWVLEGILSAFVSLLELIPVPDFLNNLETGFLSISSDVMFWLEPLKIGYGLSVIITAYIIRFVIKRLPFIG